MRYRVFKRAWWKEASQKGVWLNDLEPNSCGGKTHICYASSEEEARRLCHAHNADHDPGRYSRKYEFEELS